MITLGLFDLSLAALLVVALALSSLRIYPEIAGQLTIAAIRTAIQLTLIGLVLKVLFANSHIVWVALLSLFMLAVAGREVMARQHRRFTGWWGYGIGALSMFISSFSVALFALIIVIGNQPWYEPQYAIPLLGMLLGNTMNGIALALDRLTSSASDQRDVIEARLMLGYSHQEAIADIRQQVFRTGLIPIINAMAAAGIVSLPGMMTGQILAGAAPVEAVKYQIMIMFLISGGAGFGTMAAMHFGVRRLFDDRLRLRLDRLSKTD
ncbi:putative ABC transport system permease protein [Thiogranum longum]|uniref:Putative ABC transport system permease protein n=1 Tax=Thiogranum longum TaxID=1537524 RepID=A0A4R1H938_9GAMM|nr:iron export ABC transporter permease subunit FetB [Thiogranum longum]TCK16973.1 putative ABC transport system permease protein [Thiogranum longum]